MGGITVVQRLLGGRHIDYKIKVMLYNHSIFFLLLLLLLLLFNRLFLDLFNFVLVFVNDLYIYIRS